MPILIVTHDLTAEGSKDEGLRREHRCHLGQQGKALIGSGSMLSRDGERIGRIALLDTEQVIEAENFHNLDPFTQAGLGHAVEFRPWKIRWWFGTEIPMGK